MFELRRDVLRRVELVQGPARSTAPVGGTSDTSAIVQSALSFMYLVHLGTSDHDECAQAPKYLP